MNQKEYFSENEQELRWSKFSNEGDAQKMYDIVQNKVFPFIKNLHGNKESAYAKYMGMLYSKFQLHLCFQK